MNSSSLSQMDRVIRIATKMQKNLKSVKLFFNLKDPLPRIKKQASPWFKKNYVIKLSQINTKKIYFKSIASLCFIAKKCFKLIILFDLLICEKASKLLFDSFFSTTKEPQRYPKYIFLSSAVGTTQKQNYPLLFCQHVTSELSVFFYNLPAN